MSRPRKITDDVLERICAHVERARPLTTACNLEGVKIDTLKKLMAYDESVADRIARARSVGEDTLLGTLGDNIDSGKSTSGVQWWMEKLYPKRWGRQATQRIEQTGKDGGPMRKEIKLSIEQAIEGATRHEGEESK